MDKISFKAHLKIDDAVYKKLSKDIPRENLKKLFDDYKKFLNTPLLERMTRGDVVEIKDFKYRPYKGIEMVFHPDETDPLYKKGIFKKGVFKDNVLPVPIATSKRPLDLRFDSLIRWTIFYLEEKLGEVHRITRENPIDFFKRVRSRFE